MSIRSFSLSLLGMLLFSRFGLAEQDYFAKPAQFLAFDLVPKHLRAIARRSVRRLCTCEGIPDTCITLTSWKEPDRFLTNEHALRFFFEEEQRIRNEKEGRGGRCVFKFAVQNADGTFAGFQSRN